MFGRGSGREDMFLEWVGVVLNFLYVILINFFNSFVFFKGKEVEV